MVLSWIKDTSQRQKTGLQGYTRPSIDMGPNFIKHKDVGLKHMQMQCSSRSNSQNSDIDFKSCSKIDPEKAWTPIWLGKPILGGFAISFLCMLATLQALYFVSEKNDGLATSRDENHYLWTYGPTAVLTLVAAFWRQVDYYSKQTIPWAELANGPAPIEKTLSLDYLSPINVLTIIQAAKNKHILIVLTTSGLLLINLIIVFSTGLFVLQDSIVTNSTTILTAINRFDGSSYDWTSVDSRPVFTAYGIAAQNLSFPPGTTEQNGTFFAIQHFEAAYDSADAELTGEVSILSTDMDCETGNLTYTDFNDYVLEIQPFAQAYSVSIDFPSGCQVRDANLDAPNWSSLTENEYTVWNGYYGVMQIVNCTNQSGEAANRILVMLAYSMSHNFTNRIVSSSNILCAPKYQISQAAATYNTSLPGRISLLPSVSYSSILSDVSNWEFGAGVAQAFHAGGALSGQVGWGRNNPNHSFDSFSYMMTVLESDYNVADFLNVDLLEHATKRVFGAVGVQMANNYLTTTKNAQYLFAGTSKYMKSRLIVRELSLRLMQVLFILLIISTVILFVIAPRGVVPRDPSSIGALATIFANSKVIGIFEGAGHTKLELVKTQLAGRNFKSVVDVSGNFSIEETTSDTGKTYKPLVIDQTKIEWWRPLVVMNFAVVIVLIIPVALIISLEVSYRISTKNNGMVDIVSDGYIHYTYAYLPAAVMVVLSTLFLTLDFTIRTVQPYHALRGGSYAFQSLFDQPLGKMTLPAAWDALWKRQPAVLATTFGALLAPFLTILVSGLFTSTAVEFSSPVHLTQLDWFNISIPSYRASERQNTIVSLIVQDNLSDPRWTFSEYAFPKLEISKDHTNLSSSFDSTSAVRLTIPIFHNQINCTVVPEDQFHVKRFLEHRDFYTNVSLPPFLGINISTPDDSGNTGSLNTPISYNFCDTPHTPQTGYFGSYTYSTNRNETMTHLWIEYGRVENFTLKDLVVLKCRPYVEKVNVTVQYNLPEFTIDRHHPPQVVENSSSFHSYDQIASLKGGYTFQTLNTTSNNTNFKDLFAAIVYGRDGVPVEELLNSTKLLQNVQRVTGMVGAQFLSEVSRVPIGSYASNASTNSTATSLPAPIYSGDVVNLRHVRLVQSAISTRILQVVLAIMFTCAVVAYLLVDAKHVLAEEPGSIAAVATVLAGSSMVTRQYVPYGAEWWSDQESKKRGLFGGYIFSLGWWHTSSSPRFGIDIGKADKAKELIV